MSDRRAPSKSAREVASRSRTAATCAPHHGQQSREVIPLSATGQLGMAVHGQIQLTVVTGPPRPDGQTARRTIHRIHRTTGGCESFRGFCGGEAT
jgi:hypothetical protein